LRPGPPAVQSDAVGAPTLAIARIGCTACLHDKIRLRREQTGRRRHSGDTFRTIVGAAIRHAPLPAIRRCRLFQPV